MPNLSDAQIAEISGLVAIYILGSAESLRRELWRCRRLSGFR
jgi:hypothetical protein